MEVMFGVTTEPSKLVFNAPYVLRQQAILRSTNNKTDTIYWQILSTNAQKFIPSNGRKYVNGVLKPNEQAVMMVTCETLEKPPFNDNLTVEYVPAPDGTEKMDKSAFEGQAAIDRTEVQIVGNE